MRILVTNDDGIRAPGIAALAKAVSVFGDLTVCAPENEQSAVGRALTMSRPLRLEQVTVHGLGFPCYSVDGTPTDCVKLAIDRVFHQKPNLVVSGINRGANLGTDVLFSGTVSAAMEGAMQGIPSIAVSLGWGDEWDFDAAALWASQAVGIAMKFPMPFGSLMNINIPQGKPRGIRAARLGVLDYGENYMERVDPRGRKYYWLAGDKLPAPHESETDDGWLERGYITLTPLRFDLTDYSMLNAVVSHLQKFEETLDFV